MRRRLRAFQSTGNRGSVVFFGGGLSFVFGPVGLLLMLGGVTFVIWGALISSLKRANSYGRSGKRKEAGFGHGAISSRGWAGSDSASLRRPGLLGFVRSAFPRVLFQLPSTFKAGLPGDYAVGEVSEK